MKRRFFPLVVVLALAPSVFAQTQGGFRSDVKGPPYPWTNLNFNNAADTLRFAIVSDRTGGPRPGVLERAVNRLNLLQPEFVISVGDLADDPDDHTSVPDIDRENNILDAIVGQLKMPFFYVAGNHDIYNNLSNERYRARYGKPYYHFVYKNVLFLVLCTEDPPASNISEEQLACVKQALESNPSVRWTFVFLHKPLFTPNEKKLPVWSKIESMLKDRPYTVFAGHWHKYYAFTKSGRKHIVLATTGGNSELAGPDKRQFDEVVWVTLGESDKEPSIANLVLDGILPWDFHKPISLDEKPEEKTNQTPPPATTKNPDDKNTAAPQPPPQPVKR